MRFQFQYGTIMRSKADLINIVDQLFQFQYGTIMSLKTANDIVEQSNFNSSMVRL